MPIYIFDKNAKEKIAEVEGEEWLRHQEHMGQCSFDAFHKEWHEKIAFNKELMEQGGTLGISVEGGPSIYGLWGFNRYVVKYSGEIIFLASMSIPQDIEKAKKAGFTISQ